MEGKWNMIQSKTCGKLERTKAARMCLGQDVR